MAVLSVARIGIQQADESGADGGLTATYIANVDDKEDQISVLSSSLLPAYGTLLSAWWPAMPNAGRFYCVKRTANVDPKNPLWITVSCEFRTKLGESEDQGIGPSRSAAPRDRELAGTARSAAVSANSRDVEEPWYTDRNGNMLKNSVGDRFNLTTTRRQTVYQVDWSDSTVPDWFTTDWKYTNNALFRIRGKEWPAETLLIDATSFSDEVEEAGETMFRLSVTIIGDEDDHKRKQINEGLYELPGFPTSTDRMPIIQDGVEVRSPWPLYGSGDGSLESQAIAVNLLRDGTEKPRILEFPEFILADFTSYLPDVS